MSKVSKHAINILNHYALLIFDFTKINDILILKKDSLKNQLINLIFCYTGSPFWVEYLDEVEVVMAEFSKLQFVQSRTMAGFTFYGPTGMVNHFSVDVIGTMPTTTGLVHVV